MNIHFARKREPTHTFFRFLQTIFTMHHDSSHVAFFNQFLMNAVGSMLRKIINLIHPTLQGQIIPFPIYYLKHWTSVIEERCCHSGTSGASVGIAR